MGAWSHETFANDTAADFLYEFLDAANGMGSEDEPGKTRILLTELIIAGQAIDPADLEPGTPPPDPNEIIDADDASIALACAELVAAARGKPSAELIAAKDDDADENPVTAVYRWATKHGPKDKQLQHQLAQEIAIKAVTRVRDKSELAELWAQAKDAKDAAAWKASVEDLLTRLK